MNSTLIGTKDFILIAKDIFKTNPITFEECIPSLHDILQKFPSKKQLKKIRKTVLQFALESKSRNCKEVNIFKLIIFEFLSFIKISFSIKDRVQLKTLKMIFTPTQNLYSNNPKVYDSILNQWISISAPQIAITCINQTNTKMLAMVTISVIPVINQIYEITFDDFSAQVLDLTNDAIQKNTRDINSKHLTIIFTQIIDYAIQNKNYQCFNTVLIFVKHLCLSKYLDKQLCGLSIMSNPKFLEQMPSSDISWISDIPIRPNLCPLLGIVYAYLFSDEQLESVWGKRSLQHVGEMDSFYSIFIKVCQHIPLHRLPKFISHVTENYDNTKTWLYFLRDLAQTVFIRNSSLIPLISKQIERLTEDDSPIKSEAISILNNIRIATMSAVDIIKRLKTLSENVNIKSLPEITDILQTGKQIPNDILLSIFNNLFNLDYPSKVLGTIQVLVNNGLSLKSTEYVKIFDFATKHTSIVSSLLKLEIIPLAEIEKCIRASTSEKIVVPLMSFLLDRSNPLEYEDLMWSSIAAFKSGREIICNCYDDSRQFIRKWESEFKTNRKILPLLAHFITKYESQYDVDIMRHRCVRDGSMVDICIEYNKETYEGIVDKNMTIGALAMRAASYFKVKGLSLYVDYDQIPDTELVDDYYQDEIIAKKSKTSKPSRNDFPSLLLDPKLFLQIDDVAPEEVMKVLDLLPSYPSNIFTHEKPLLLWYNVEELTYNYTDKSDISSVINELLTYCLDIENKNILKSVFILLSKYFKDHPIPNVQSLFDKTIAKIKETHLKEAINFGAVIAKEKPAFNDISLVNELLIKLKMSEAVALFEPLDIPLDAYVKMYNESQYDPSPMFYLSMADHMKGKPANSDVIKIIKRNFGFSTNKEKIGHLSMIREAVDWFPNNIKTKTITHLLNNYLTLGVDSSDSCFEEAMKILERFADSPLVKQRIEEILPEDVIVALSVTIPSEMTPRATTWRGIRNQGATCFINSIVQQLFWIKEYRQLIYDYDGEDELYLNLMTLFSRLEMSNKQYISAKRFNSTIDPDRFDISHHQDAFEFLLYILETIEPSFFRGVIKNTIKSVSDERESSSFEDFNVLSVEVTPSLSESISRFSSPDIIDDYSFDDSKGKCQVKRFSVVDKVSDYLIIQLKRFEFDLQTMSRRKVNSPCKIPKDLEILGKKYQLTGVVMHRGTANGGHYTSYVKIDNVWNYFNDRNVTTAKEETVLSDAEGNDSLSAYLLFYKLENLPEIKISFDFSEVEDYNLERDICRLTLRDPFIEFMTHSAKYFPEVAVRFFFNAARSSNRSGLIEKLVSELMKYPKEFFESNIDISRAVFAPRRKTRQLACSLLDKYSETQSIAPFLVGAMSILPIYSTSCNEFFGLCLKHPEGVDWADTILSAVNDEDFDWEDADLTNMLKMIEESEDVPDELQEFMTSSTTIQNLLDGKTKFDSIVAFLHFMKCKLATIEKLVKKYPKNKDYTKLKRQLEMYQE